MEIGNILMNITVAMLIRNTNVEGWYAPLFALERDGENLRWKFTSVWITVDGPDRHRKVEDYFFSLPTLVKLTSKFNLPFFILENRRAKGGGLVEDFHVDHLTNGYVDYADLQIESWHGENI